MRMTNHAPPQDGMFSFLSRISMKPMPGGLLAELFLLVALTRAPSFSICDTPGALGTDKAIFLHRFQFHTESVGKFQL